MSSYIQSEKERLKEKLNQQIGDMLTLEEKFEELGKTRQTTPLIERLRVVHHDEYVRISHL